MGFDTVHLHRSTFTHGFSSADAAGVAPDSMTHSNDNANNDDAENKGPIYNRLLHFFR